MDTSEALNRLRRHEPELRDLGVASLSLFGSVARGEQGNQSDVDVAVRFDPAAGVGLFGWAGIAGRLEELLDGKVDMISEPARGARFQAAIDRDRLVVF
jgi:predicted nucleotidyltransferase